MTRKWQEPVRLRQIEGPYKWELSVSIWCKPEVKKYRVELRIRRPRPALNIYEERKIDIQTFRRLAPAEKLCQRLLEDYNIPTAYIDYDRWEPPKANKEISSDQGMLIRPD